MPTYEVRCGACNQRKWPSLPEKPARYVCARYVCALCVAVGLTEGGKRRDRARKASQTRKIRRRASGDTP